MYRGHARGSSQAGRVRPLTHRSNVRFKLVRPGRTLRKLFAPGSPPRASCDLEDDFAPVVSAGRSDFRRAVAQRT